MPRRMYEFECSEGHIKEHFIDSEETTTKCPECGSTSKRIISSVRSKLDPFGDFPDAADKWARQHEKLAKVKQ